MAVTNMRCAAAWSEVEKGGFDVGQMGGRREVYEIAATGVTIFIVPISNYVVTSPH